MNLFTRESPKLRKQKGSGLVMLMLALVVLGVTITAISNKVKAYEVTLKSMKERSALEDLKNFLHLSVNCALTQPEIEVACQDPDQARDSLVRVFGRSADIDNPRILIASDPQNLTKLGPFLVRAKCGDRLGALDFEFRSDANPSHARNWKAVYPLSCF